MFGDANPAFADIDGDGDFDAFDNNNYNGENLFFMNINNANNSVFAPRETNPSGLRNVAHYDHPNFVDIDDDDDLDAFISPVDHNHGYGNVTSGDTLFFENKGTARNPAFAAPELHLLGLLGFSNYPTFVDIDDDGDLDAFVG